MVEPFFVAHLANVLLFGDDQATRRALVTYFNDNNIRTRTVGDPANMLRTIMSNEPDLVILDLETHEDDELDLIRDIRSKSNIPVVVIANDRHEEIDRLIGLELGADEYLSRPFNPRELLARTRTLLRRHHLNGGVRARRAARCTYAFNGWSFEPTTQRLVAPEGHEVPLSKNESALLNALVSVPGQTLSRERLIQATRVHDDVFDRTIDVQILRLRRKLGDNPYAPRFIRTMRGVGYVFDADIEVQ